MSNSNRLHQLLAVESDLTQQARNIMEETVNTFTKKQGLFDGVQKVYKPFNVVDGTIAEQIPDEIKEIVTTVSEKLDYAMASTIRAMDATLSKEETNSSGTAKAQLKVGNTDFGEFSATSLLALEKILVRVRDEYKTIPTLDPTKHWDKDTSTNRDIYNSQVDVKFRVVRKNKPIILAPATDKHPAQVQMVQDEEQVGKYETVYSSGSLSVADKSKLLENIDNLILAVKQAREEANSVQVKQVKIGDSIFKYIHG